MIVRVFTTDDQRGSSAATQGRNMNIILKTGSIAIMAQTTLTPSTQPAIVTTALADTHMTIAPTTPTPVRPDTHMTALRDTHMTITTAAHTPVRPDTHMTARPVISV